MNLTDYHLLFGDWRELFRYIERFDRVTKADIRRVAQTMFQPTNRIIGMIETVPPTKVSVPPSSEGGQL